jgi:CubicO group peptidase (beta-lactamase class C family)
MTEQGVRGGSAADGAESIKLDDGRSIHGFVEEGFGPVMDAFVGNFVHRRELGAGCTAFVVGRPVADIWGGLADQRVGRPWQRETAAVIFSCSKGILAVCAYTLVQEGRLDLDTPIARYWPAFGEHGKAAITVRQAMSHRAGLPSLDVDLNRHEVLAWEPVIRAMEEQQPMYPPSAGHIYHALTYGWLVGEVIRRITGLTPGQYFRHAIGDRLRLQTWIGIPDEARVAVAWMEPPLADEDSDAARQNARLLAENPILERSLSLGRAFVFPAENGFVTFNYPAIQAAEIPGANGISSAESLARLYSACVSQVDVPPLLSLASIEDAIRVQSAGPQLSGAPDDGTRWGTGFQLSSPPSQPMIGPTSFGHAGAGGQLAFADLAHGVGFAYLSNQMGGYGDERARELTTALRAALRA